MRSLNITLDEESVVKLDALCRQADDNRLPSNRSVLLRMIIGAAPDTIAEVLALLGEKAKK